MHRLKYIGELRKKVSRSEVFSGIEEFEKKLEHTETNKEPQLEKASVPVNANTSVTSIEKLEKESSNTRDANSYLKKIKAKRSEEHASRKEKEQRRRKVLMEQQQVFKDLEESRRREVLLEKLMKKSMEERQLAKELNEIKQLKQVMKENREIREKQYAERRRKDFEEKQRRETDLMEKEKEERKIKKRELIEKHKLLLEEKSKQKREKHWNICFEISNQIIDLSFKEIEYAETTEGEKPTTAEILEWRKMFVKGVYDDESTKEDDAELEQSREMEQSLQTHETVDLDVIDMAEFKDYLSCKGVWKESSDETEKVSNFIKDVVSKLHDKIHPLPSPKTEPVLKSKYSYNVILTGKPMSGKSTVCKKIASQLSLFHINTEAILKSLLDGENKSSEYSEIANRARACLLDGREIDEEIIVDLILLEIEKVEKIENTTYQGWLIEGYPLTLEAAKILERRISGYTPSVEEFVGTDSEVKLNSVILNQNSCKKSDEELMKRLVPFQAFTSVIFIDVEDELVFERLADQKVDPLTGTVYHMIYSPPESVDISTRLVPIDEHVRLDKAQINSQLVSFAKSKRELMNWYKKFENVFEAKENSIDDLVKECSNIITNHKREPFQNHIQTEPENSEIEQSGGPEKKELDVEFCKLFLSEWMSIEQNYVGSCKLVFRNLRDFRKSFFKQFSDLKEQFMNFLLRPDDKQVYITQFQNDFNRLPLELRSNSQVKDELHRRSEDLKETLWTLCDEKKLEAEKELEEHQKESWLKTHKKAVTRQYMQLIQLELNRFIEQSKFLFDYFVEQYFSNDLSIGATIDLKKTLSAPILSVNIEELFVDVISGASNTKSTNKKPTKPSTNSSTRSKIDQQDQDLNIEDCFERAKTTCDTLDLLITLQNYIDKNGKKKKEKTKDPYVDIPLEVRECMGKEKEIFLRRITLIKERCLNSLKDQLESKSNHIFGTMRDWIGQRYRTDMANIGLLSRTIQDFIEKETPIVNEMRIEGNKCIIDESVQMTNPLPLHSTSRSQLTTQEAPETVVSFTKSFTPHQVFSLYERLQAPSPSGFVELEEITTTLLILIDSTFGSMELPNQWLDYDNDKVREITKRFDPFKKGYINWRTFLLSALFTFFHRLPTIEDIRKLLLIVHPLVSSGETNLKQEQFTDLLIRWIGETGISSNEEEIINQLLELSQRDLKYCPI
ncbi:cpc1/kpl2 [Naegleria gruberi]|uniref:Cpc1/kpl2 n=1 Tax=Naegleria gruberi TaxID=5762 RepID=D2UY01_NAEGR|nr:cpc1/kpl2 [Naegleria gruberi]EFC50384.1 cpc1/kpl2 [Naegleria gruberi]|eukprot:XP_002683128.1 cpc1/kpl2 [Naegleria gruberi]